MKIGHVTNFLPGYHKSWGGAEQVAHRLARAQVEGGHQVTVFTTRPTETQDEAFEVVAIDRLSDFSWRLSQIVRRFPFADRNRPYCDPIARRSLARALAEHRPDVIHFHNINELTLSVVAAAAAAHIPSVLSVYDYWYFCPNEMLIDEQGQCCWRFHGAQCVPCLKAHRGRGFIPESGHLRLSARLTLRFRRWAVDRFLNRISAFVVLSEASGELLRRYGIEPRRMHVVRQPFDFEESCERDPGAVDPHSLLYVGWIQYKKGLHIIIEALAQLAPRYPNLKLHVIGQPCDPVYSEQIDGLVRTHGLEDHVVMHGKLPHESVREFMAQSQVLVLAEQWENMSPVVLVEAMALGTPVVAGGIGGIPEFIEHGLHGLVAKYDDPADFADRISQVLDDPASAEARAAAAAARARQLFDPQQIVDRVLEVYQQLDTQ